MINYHQKEFIKLLERLAAGHRNIFDAFRDVVGCIACAVEQLCHWPQERDGRYNSIVANYTEDELELFPKALDILVEGLEARRESFLGPVLEEIGVANTRDGQFLTPVSVSNLMGRVTAPAAAANHRPGELVKLYDPACGAGVLMISQAEELVKAGVPPSDIFIVAGDIDQRALDCAFSEFSLLGYSARVERRNALTMELLGKPRWTVNYFIYGTQWREGKRNAQ